MICLEGVNARHLTSGEIPEEVDLLVCDASFISIAKVLEKAIYFVRKGVFW
ncbi:hypothetical protein [Fodinicurvata halophila]|uniref:hypothetical protein n=1 Tax=Fodinicurvata halophila TaxID=1419723 RepID=UPI003639895E